jgi:nucleoid DNA-binding protein
MKTPETTPPNSELDAEDSSPNVTKRKLVIEIVKEMQAEEDAAQEEARKTGKPRETKHIPTQQEALAVVQKLLDHISKALAEGQKIELLNFGVFEVKTRKPRVGRNPNRPEVDVPIPQRSVVKFKAGKEMREAVLKITALPSSAA